MRKRLSAPNPLDNSTLDEGWLDLDAIAVVEVTSEENGYPVESAMVSSDSGAGVQPILAFKLSV